MEYLRDRKFKEHLEEVLSIWDATARRLPAGYAWLPDMISWENILSELAQKGVQYHVGPSYW